MRPFPRLLPLPLAIAIALPVMAQEREMPPNYGLCPVEDAVPRFPEAPPTNLGIAPSTRSTLPTEVEGDEQSG